MTDERDKLWAIHIPQQQLKTVFKSATEANLIVQRLTREGVRCEVTGRAHCPEECWCGDDHSP